MIALRLIGQKKGASFCNQSQNVGMQTKVNSLNISSCFVVVVVVCFVYFTEKVTCLLSLGIRIPELFTTVNVKGNSGLMSSWSTAIFHGKKNSRCERKVTREKGNTPRQKSLTLCNPAGLLNLPHTETLGFYRCDQF